MDRTIQQLLDDLIKKKEKNVKLDLSKVSQTSLANLCTKNTFFCPDKRNSKNPKDVYRVEYKKPHTFKTKCLINTDSDTDIVMTDR